MTVRRELTLRIGVMRLQESKWLPFSTHRQYPEMQNVSFLQIGVQQEASVGGPVTRRGSEGKLIPARQAFTDSWREQALSASRAPVARRGIARQKSAADSVGKALRR